MKFDMKAFVRKRLLVIVVVQLACLVAYVMIYGINIGSNLKQGDVLPSSKKWIVLLDDEVNQFEIKSMGRKTDWTLVVLTNATTITRSATVIQFGKRQYENLDDLKSFTHSKTMAMNLAMMYAINNGAHYIFQTDKRTLLEHNFNPNHLFVERWLTLMPSQSKGVFNPKRHYGWQDDVDDSRSSYKVVKNPRWNILQVIGVRRNCHGAKSATPDIVIPGGMVSKWYAPASNLFYKDSFWGLLVLPSMRENRILKDMWVQRLLGIAQGHYGFVQETNLYFNDNEAVDEEYVNIVTAEMANWSCGRKDMPSCMRSLASFLNSKGIFSDHDIQYLDWWILQLQKMEYRFDKKVSEKTPEFIDNITFYPPKLNCQNETPKTSLTLSKIKKFCPAANVSHFKSRMSTDVFDNILLLISYNMDHTKNIELLKLLYEFKFPNHLICAPGNSSSQLLFEHRTSFVSSDWFGENTHNEKTAMIVDCMTKSIGMNYNVHGLLHISDDVALYPWNLKLFDRMKIWSTPDASRQPIIGDAKSKLIFDQSNLAVVGHLPSWIAPYVNSSLIKALDEMRNSSNFVFRCHKRLKHLLKGNYRFFYGQADIFYVPKHLWRSFFEVLNLFNKNNVFLEIAIPTALKCVTSDEPQHLTLMHFDPGSARVGIERSYDKYPSAQYIHPFKFGSFLTNNVSRSEIFCESVIRHYFTH